jgi:FAD/FMN-containing dehydrogenase
MAMLAALLGLLGSYLPPRPMAQLKIPLVSSSRIVDYADYSISTQQVNRHHYLAIVTALNDLDHQLDGSVLLSSQEEEEELSEVLPGVFEAAAQVWRACQAPPFSVIEAKSERDVQLALPVLVSLKRLYNFEFRVRSGGHHKAGYSTIGQHGAVLSLTAMTRLDVLPPSIQEGNNNASNSSSSSSIARMQPGVRVEQFLGHLLGDLGYSGVMGACNSVAEGGFVLGGGFGFQSRLYGLGADSVASMRMVLSNGQVIEVTQGDDLFWALRGAGSGNFGVVTQMDYRVYPTDDRFQAIMLSVGFPDLALAMYQIGLLEPEIPRTMMMFFDMIDPISKQPVFTFGVFGQDQATSHAAMAFVETRVLALLPESSWISKQPMAGKWTDQVSGWNASKVRTANNPEDSSSASFDWGSRVWAAQAWCGFLLPENNTRAVWNEIVQYLERGLNESSYLQPDIELWGGAISDVASNATAFVHRSAVYNVGVLLTVPPDLDNAEQVFQEQSARVNAWWPDVAKHLTGVYVNYPMASLSSEEYPRAYWGKNLERLIQIKQQYDVENYFAYEQSIPMSF